MKRIVIIILTLIIISFIFNSCKAARPGAKTGDATADAIKNKVRSKYKSTDNVETIFAVNTTTAVKGEIRDYIELNGDVKSKTEVDVFPDVIGKLKGYNVTIGQYVYKDQILAYVDPSRPGMDYKWSPVKSPINGTVTDLPLDLGATVSQQMSVAKVGKLDQIEITTNIAEKFISKIKLGLNAYVNVEAYPDITFNARISEVSPVINPQTRMMGIKLSILGDTRLLKPGMFAEIKIITEKKQNIVKIPSDGYIIRFGQKYVFVINDQLPKNIDMFSFNEDIIDILEDKEKISIIKSVYTLDKNEQKYILKENVSETEQQSIFKIFDEINYPYQIAVQRKITTGIQIDNKLEIVEGLNPNEKIVVRGQSLLEDNSRVKIIDQIKPLSEDDPIE